MSVIRGADHELALTPIAGITDVRARAAALDLRLRADVRASALGIDALARNAARGDGRSRDVLLAFAWLRATRDDPALVSALASVANGLTFAEPLFRSTSSARGLAHRARIEPQVPAHRALAAFRPAPSVSRAQLSIVFRATRERAIRDPRASVVARLLASAHIELRDVLRIASRRPSSPDIAVAVAASRYLPELSVREALVRNPYTPAWLSLVLLPTVRHRVLDLAVAHEELRAYARALAAGG